MSNLMLNGILVVEGNEDKAYLSSFIASPIFTVNGLDIKSNSYKFLKKYSLTHSVIVLTDPDEAGNQIRNHLNEECKNVINVEIDINKCTRGKKQGVAECEKEEIVSKLDNYLVSDVNNETLSYSDLYKVGLIENKELRNKFSTQIGLGCSSGKQLLKMLNLLEIDIEEVMKVIENIKDGNK